jgi:CubicO group peptidase (beta-lactamase class C family)
MQFSAYDGAVIGTDPVGSDASPEEIPMDAARSPLDAPVGDTLSDRDRRILEFERQWWKYAGAKEQAVRDLFDMSATRYYQILNGLIDDPAALAFDPMLVKRLRRMRAARQRARSARRLGVEPDVR